MFRLKWKEMTMGEATDKLTILEVKYAKLGGPESIKEQIVEMTIGIENYIEGIFVTRLSDYEQAKYWSLKEQLYKNNYAQWDWEDKVLSSTEAGPGLHAAKMSRRHNARRALIKKEIDVIFKEKYLEIKKYAEIKDAK